MSLPESTPSPTSPTSSPKANAAASAPGPSTQRPLPQPDFSTFPRHAELMALLQAYATARPDTVELRTLGQSHEGRPIPLVVLGRRDGRPDTDKPAIWVDGNIHAAELTACTACLYWLHALLEADGRDAATTALLDTRVVYLVPRLNPDGAELALADRPRHIRSSTRPYPFDEAPVEGLSVEDVDGDGRVLYMRQPDANGSWKPHPEDARLMIPREPGDLTGPFFRVLPEGRIHGWDGVACAVNPDREGLDLNRNFPANWRQEKEQLGAGPYPTSEPEVRAMVDFVTQHPNIGLAISFHTHSGVILRPSGTESDDALIPEDLWLFQQLSTLGTEMTGYPAVSVFHEFRYHPKEVITGTQDWVYDHLGIPCWTVELWAPNREAGITGYKWIDWYRTHPPADDLKLLQWSDRACGGRAHVDWYPFEHPQLGPVELGGWDKMNYWRNPPPELREAEVARFPRWLTTLGLTLPKLEWLKQTVEPLGDGLWRVHAAVTNAGFLSSATSKRAAERKVVRGTVFEIELPAGATLVEGKARVVGEVLEGHRPKSGLQGFLPERRPLADRAGCSWVLRAPAGTQVGVRVRADRAGALSATLRLGG